ncbi:M20/M25/M40 family metallo-hydrolase [Congregibacter litoralis]|uniref:Acetylornithine deacetylase/Succinyl-diaminopimelate desuccinylase n=1 Tax=Congregibacter litoralis KT71 TaxID=314285 RepID=A4ADK2_9GAMM|nr:M20/M25/M40 family metallo-hydrolase [Congregibacter litoralis]EAQ95891.2 Acetylornithine deacetylase/Succinyl-diaminopimelate desuccinylase [Congregibacter litoralis KT71]
MHRSFWTALCLSVFSISASAQIESEHAQKTLEIYRTIVEVDTSKTMGNTIPVAEYLAGELIAAGFAEEDVRIVPKDGFGTLIATYRGDGSAGAKPILLLGHMDVVEALAEDWVRPPFELTQDDVNFYARGTIDNKFGVAQLTGTMIRLKKEGFVPDRDLMLVFSGDEESGMTTTRMMAYEMPEIAEAEYALNSDAGGGALTADGVAVSYRVQAAEKTYATWQITVRNPGGHSSRPRDDNAIYELAAAVKAIEAHRFPVRWSEMTLSYFQQTGEKIGGELGDAMVRFAYDPEDEEAAEMLRSEPSYVGTTRTTCVVTMLEAGHAENALPQSATATVNCRIFPGVSVADIEAELKSVVGNEEAEFVLLGDPTESPISEIRADVMTAVGKAVHSRYPGLDLITYMESGGTDGMHFRKAGIPTWGISGVFMNPDEMFAHGLNERVPIKAFYDALDHWSVIIRELTTPE